MNSEYNNDAAIRKVVADYVFEQVAKYNTRGLITKYNIEVANGALDSKDNIDAAMRALVAKYNYDVAIRALDSEDDIDAAMRALDSKYNYEVANGAFDPEDDIDAVNRALDFYRKADAAMRAYMEYCYSPHWRGEAYCEEPCITPKSADTYAIEIDVAMKSHTYVCFRHYIPATRIPTYHINGYVEMIPVYGEMVDATAIRFTSDGTIEDDERPITTRNEIIDVGFFGGEWLRARPRAKVMVVQSEPAAVYGRLAYDEYIWLAVGCGKPLCNAHLNLLEGRRFSLVPTAEEYSNGWYEIAEEWGCDVVNDYIDLSNEQFINKLQGEVYL